MNIIDMRYLASTTFPTDAVENGCQDQKKIGKSR